LAGESLVESCRTRWAAPSCGGNHRVKSCAAGCSHKPGGAAPADVLDIDVVFWEHNNGDAVRVEPMFVNLRLICAESAGDPLC